MSAELATKTVTLAVGGADLLSLDNEELGAYLKSGYVQNVWWSLTDSYRFDLAHRLADGDWDFRHGGAILEVASGESGCRGADGSTAKRTWCAYNSAINYVRFSDGRNYQGTPWRDDLYFLMGSQWRCLTGDYFHMGSLIRGVGVGWNGGHALVALLIDPDENKRSSYFWFEFVGLHYRVTVSKLAYIKGNWDAMAWSRTVEFQPYEEEV